MLLTRVFALLMGLVFFSGCYSLPPRDGTHFADLDYGLGEERDLYVDGLRIRVHEGGKRDAPTVVLLHCFALNMKVWRDVIPALEKHFHVVAYDAVGHGKSAKVQRPITLDYLADVALGVLDALDIDHAILVGNSMGGGTSLKVALKAPQRVDGLVLVDSVGLWDRHFFAPFWGMVGKRGMSTSVNWSWHAAMRIASQKESPLVRSILADVIAARRDPEDPRVSHGYYEVVGDIIRTDHTRDLPFIQTPALVLVGKHDRLVSVDHARRLAHGLPRAELVEFDTLGHLPEMEDGAEVNRVLLPFVKRVASR
jgi:pimeloyl-ACP methyl ester carboxylesterase